MQSPTCESEFRLGYFFTEYQVRAMEVDIFFEEECRKDRIAPLLLPPKPPVKAPSPGVYSIVNKRS